MRLHFHSCKTKFHFYHSKVEFTFTFKVKKGTSAKKQVDASCKTKFHLSTKPPCSEL